MKITNLENYVKINLGVIENAINWIERNSGLFSWEFSDKKLAEYISTNSGNDVKVERHVSKIERVYLSYDGVKIPLYFNANFWGTYAPYYCVFPEGDETMNLIKYMELLKSLGDFAKYKMEHPHARNAGMKKSLEERAEYEFNELMFLYKNYGLGKEIFSYEWVDSFQEVFILKDDKPFIKVNLEDFMKGYALRDILRMREVLKNISFFYPKK